ncbi:MAG TPA: heavy metal translocating P-type ATPase metal-binding domain-containing protein [Phnomibacter sp.]|nr:heavy metal translocating P-type ATPase metal-binding domain-containing protein [Phnomibacter sp.]
MEQKTTAQLQCYHCGEAVTGPPIAYDDKSFCCAGCKTVYQVLNQHGLCEYYAQGDAPGINQRVAVRKDKFAFLENDTIRQQLIRFADAAQTQAVFYLPQMHCASCLWLLEHLQKLNPGIHYSRVDFPRKEVTVTFNEQQASLRAVAELLTSIGYEPHISLNNLEQKPRNLFNRKRLYKLGVAGFCFSNIMLLSFPEYFGLEGMREQYDLTPVFRYLNLLLSLPVLFYSASEFFQSGWAGLRNRFLNIDAPIALAILITFGRSVYEIVSGTGAGYLDSMSGIVFFMLIGRFLQDRTQQSLSFDRDYTSYFPIAVNKLVEGKEIPTPLPDLHNGDSVVIHSQEIIPADGILVRGEAAIDYSFVTGESIPVEKKISEIIYAGGRQVGGKIELLLVKDVSQSYLTNLWNKESMRSEDSNTDSWVHPAARYFTAVLFTLTAIAAVYWFINDPTKLWPAVTAALIVACPCSLLLSHSFTNGHVMRAFDRAGLYIRNASVIERMTRITHVVFDKTGTLTDGQQFDVTAKGDTIDEQVEAILAAVSAQSHHPLSKAIHHYLDCPSHLPIEAMKEYPGKGIEAWVNDRHVRFGSPAFVWGEDHFNQDTTVVAWSIDKQTNGLFLLKNHYRKGLTGMLTRLRRRFNISVLSGDNDAEQGNIYQMVKQPAKVLFNQAPADKLAFIESLQQSGEEVLMVGDGLNDAGALKVARVGIAVTDDINNFSPGCDAILEAARLKSLHQYLWMARRSKQVVIASFVLSILYNIVGLSFAFQGLLSPLVAAILMPSSSISIIVLTWLGIESGRRRLKDTGPVNSRKE